MIAVARAHAQAENEIDRILSLPRVEPSTVDWTETLRRPGGTWGLRPIQSAALGTLYTAGGLFAPIRVGGGKTLISHLAPVVLGAKVGLVFTTAPNVLGSVKSFQKQTTPHFRTAPVVVRSYDSLSRPDASDYLERFAERFGDSMVIVCDEAHKLRALDAARTRRMGRFLLAHPGVVFCALTGSITKHGIADFAHLADWALGRGSPLPRPQHKAILESWAAVIDVDGRPGQQDWRAVEPLVAWADERFSPHESGRSAVRRALAKRMRSAPGVVTSADGDGHDGALTIRVRPVVVPPEVSDAIATTIATDTKPNGDPFTDDLDAARTLRQLAGGWYYVWAWPGVPDTTWLEARRRWHRHVRAELQANHAEGYDSPLLVQNRIEREAANGAGRSIHHAWRAWLPHKAKDPPPTVPVWVSGFLAADAVRWACEREAASEPGIVWYQSRAMEAALASSGLPVYGAGSTLPEDRPHVCAASVRSHGTGRNLQRWRRALVVEPPAAGDVFEQLIGRLHRDGQNHDVVFEVYQHVAAYVDLMKKVREDAEYLADLTYVQKLQIAEYEGFDE